MAKPDRFEVMKQAVGAVNTLLAKQFPELSPAEHAFICDHASMLLHQSFHQQALVDQQMEAAKKPKIIVPEGPING